MLDPEKTARADRTPSARRARSASTVSLVKCRAVLQCASQRGVPAARLHALLGVDPAGESRLDGHVPYETYAALWERAVAESKDPSLPLAAAALPLEDYEIVGFLVRTSASVAEAFSRARRFQALWMSGIGWDEPRRAGGEVTLTWLPSALPAAHLGERCVREHFLASMMNGIRAVTQSAVRARRITLAHSPLAPPPAYVSVFGVEPASGAEAASLTIAAADFDRAIPTGNVPLAHYLERQCEAVLGARTGEPPTSARVRRLLVDAMKGELPALGGAARRLAMSPRTLMRRLAEEGRTYHGLLDEVRCEAARRHLAEGRLRVYEVAYLTGFRSVSAFHRAYRRWTGEPPSAVARSGM